MHAPVKFLLVDDLEGNLLALEALLQQEGLEILKACSGTEALELLLVHDVALAIVDVQMPGMDGFELAELMRGTERTRRVPIIFLTAGAIDEQRRFRGYDAGAVDFLFKPVNPHILRSKAEVFFELYRQRQEVARQREELRARAEENARLLEESRRTTRELQEADRRKDEFLAMLAHELRNPLAPILTAVAVLRARGPADPQLQRQREIIKRQAEHMARIVADLLEVSRISRGNLTLQSETLNLVETVRSCVDDYRLGLENSGVRVDADLPQEPLIVQGDRVRLCQAVGNLLNNAGKFTTSGDRICVGVRKEVKGDLEQAVVSVRDTGAGIPAELLPTIWESFVQGRQDLARTTGGLGLGLALVKGIVEMHGGAIAASSAGPGQGAEFTISLPLLPTPPPTPASSRPPAAREAPGRRGEGRRVLIIEDNRDAAETLQELLGIEGYEVRLAFSGQEGVEAARAWSPHLILCDIGLPGMNGYGVAEALRRDRRTQGTRLVAISGYSQPEDVERGRAAGFDAYLPKPVDPEVLMSIAAGETIHEPR